MNIELNKDQYRKLIQLVYIGEWVVNSYKENQEDYRFTDIEQYIYTFYKQFGCSDLIEFDEETDMFLPTADMDEKMLEYIDEYLESNKGDFIGFN
jgi:hypothetical protein